MAFQGGVMKWSFTKVSGEVDALWVGYKMAKQQRDAAVFCCIQDVGFASDAGGSSCLKTLN